MDVAKANIRVMPRRRDILASDEDREVAELAYHIWLESGFQGGSPEEALASAMQQLGRKNTTGLFVVPKRQPVRRNIYPLSWLGLN
jgi:hypothetical protein